MSYIYIYIYIYIYDIKSLRVNTKLTSKHFVNPTEISDKHKKKGVIEKTVVSTEN